MSEKVVVVMPAYNAGRTLRLTYEELPKDTVSLVILVDDGSTDGTLEVARQLGLEIFVHNRNYGYGANQKTCYAEALRAGADIVVMVHPDYQYDPRLVPQIIDPIVRGEADVVFGSRLKSGSALAQGMPWWKYFSNRFLTNLENRTFDLSLSEFHTGYRAFRREVLETVNLGRLHLRPGDRGADRRVGLPHRGDRGADAVLPGGLVGELVGVDRLRAPHPLAPRPLQPAPAWCMALAGV